MTYLPGSTQVRSYIREFVRPRHTAAAVAAGAAGAAVAATAGVAAAVLALRGELDILPLRQEQVNLGKKCRDRCSIGYSGLLRRWLTAAIAVALRRIQRWHQVQRCV